MKKEQQVKECLKGFMDTIPLGLSAGIYGVVYGVMASKAGLSIGETIGMSAFVFAGASQMTAVQMVAIGSSPLSIILTILIINLRHFLMGASIAPYLKHESKKIKMLNAYFMTDESYAVAYSHFQSKTPTSIYFLGSGLNIYVLWGLAGIIGYFFGNIISSELNYIFDFAFIAAFIGMIVPMIKDLPTLTTVIASAAVSLGACQVIEGKWYIIIAGVLASLAGYVTYQLTNKTGKSDAPEGGIEYEC